MVAIRVTSEELARQGQQVAQGSAHVSEILSQLRQSVGELGSQWEGQAAASFQDLFHEWQAGAEQVRHAMDGIATFLGQAARSYEETEASLKQATGR